MSYCRKWIPPTIPLRDDLDAWKILFQDLHDSLLVAGLNQTDTPGQLVIQDVGALPADGQFAGFIEYAFDDDLQEVAPVVIKLEYGCGREGLWVQHSNSRTRTPRVRATVSVGGVEGQPSQSPQELNNSSGGTSSPQLTNPGLSTICYAPERGFLGVVYGAGSRNKPFNDASGTSGYYGASLSLFVQRSVDAFGAPTAEGVMLYAPRLINVNSVNSLWSSGILPPAMSQYVSVMEGAMPINTNTALRINGNDLSVIDGEVQTQQVFCATPTLKPFPWVVSYNPNDIPEGLEFGLEVFPGTTSNFVALGRETNMSVDQLLGQRAGLAMLFE